MELAALVAEALLAGAESTEVLDGLGDDIVEELEVDAAGASCPHDVSFDDGQAGRQWMDDLRASLLSKLVTRPESSTWA